MIALQVVGALAVVMVPGWAWSLTLAPMHWVERTAVAFGLGLAIVPMGAFVWTQAGLPLGWIGAWAYLLLLTGAGLGAWRLVLRMRPDHVRQEAQEQELHGEEEQDA